MEPINRRRLMKLGAGALIAKGLWPGALAAQDVAATDISFICVNDTHYIDQQGLPFFQKMVQKMKGLDAKPSLMLVVGDTCEHGTPAQLGGMREVFKAVGLPTKVVIGNHDWTTQTDRKAYEQLWPNSINYMFEHDGWQFVGLDTSDGVKYERTSILKPTFDWLEQNLPKLDKKRPLIVFTHFPLGSGVRYSPANSEEVLNHFREFNLRAVFNGHFHSLTERTIGDYLITTNRCCAFARNNHDNSVEKGFFICRTKDGKVIREFVEVSRDKAPA